MKLKYKLKEYVEVIKSVNNGNIKLSIEQFEYLKELSLKKGFIVGMHNTGVENLDSFFEVGLYNNRDYLFKETCDLTNTVAYSSAFLPKLYYHNPIYITIILMIPEDVIEGKKGIFEKLNDGGWGIPYHYIVGAFKDGKIFINKNYNNKYYNPDSKLVEEPEEIFRKYEERKEEINICSKAFYDAKIFKNDEQVKKV